MTRPTLLLLPLLLLLAAKVAALPLPSFWPMGPVCYKTDRLVGGRTYYLHINTERLQTYVYNAENGKPVGMPLSTYVTIPPEGYFICGWRKLWWRQP